MWIMPPCCWNKCRLQREKILERNQEVLFQWDNYSRKPYIPHSLVVHLSLETISWCKSIEGAVK